MRMLMAAAALGLLAACATATPYQPAADGGHYGFQEQAIESNRVRISFNGNSLTDRDTVEAYLLFRAAEITLERGLDYFVVANRDTEEHSRLQSFGPVRSPFISWYYSPRRGWLPWSDPFWDSPDDYREITRYEAVAEIAMFDGAKPADNPDAFDARDVQANLGGRIARPPPTG
jgi:hypothetical protein